MEIDIGMLWFDDTPAAPIGERIERAANHYKGKYGRLPNVCYVHSGCSAETDCRKLPIKVLVSHDVLPSHFWLGVAEAD